MRCLLPQELSVFCPLPPPLQVMRVVDGRHSGLLCEVQALEPREEGRSGALGGWGVGGLQLPVALLAVQLLILMLRLHPVATPPLRLCVCFPLQSGRGCGCCRRMRR